jgi:hypothetical protein
MGDEGFAPYRELGGETSATGRLKPAFPHDAPPKSFLRRYRAALLTATVLLFVALLVVAFVRVRTMATYTSDAGGFTVKYERRFADIGYSPLGSTAETHIAEVALKDQNADLKHGDDPTMTGFRIIVEELPGEDRGLSLVELAQVWSERQSASTATSDTVESPYAVDAVVAGECLHTTVTRRYQDWLWRVETYAFVRGDRLYTITFSARTDEWDEQWPHFEKVLDSFRITYEPPGT